MTAADQTPRAIRKRAKWPLIVLGVGITAALGFHFWPQIHHYLFGFFGG